ncbi:MAG: diguanylate cyclase [Acidobacteria bacterium]|nr:diguanylate cyclase [Acidobacteriota bacterium]
MKNHCCCLGTLSLTVIALFFIASFPASALDPSKKLDQHTLNMFTTEDGLPQSSVMNLVQTGDGYIWMGTFEGLARYDGEQFTVFNKNKVPELENNTIKALFKDSHGCLWIGTPSGLSCYRQGVFRHFTVKDGLAGNFITAISEDRDHHLWVGTNSGVSTYDNMGHFTSFTVENGLMAGYISALAPSPDGGIWVGTQLGLDRIQKGKIRHFDVPSDFPRMNIHTLYLEQSGSTLWIGIQGSGLITFRDNRFERIGDKQVGLTDVRAIFRDREGTLWIGSNGGGLLTLSQTGQFSVISEKEGLVNTSVRALLEDREGSLWVGTRGGLFQLKDDKFTLLNTRNGLPVDSVRSLLPAKKGGVWIGTVGGGLTLYQNDRVTTFKHLEARYIWSLAEDSDNSLWVGTYGNGLYHLKKGRFTNYSTQNGLSNNVVRAILVLPNGEIWVGTNGGGISIISKTSIRTITKKEGLSENYIYSLAQDREGTIWAGTYNSGINRIQNGKITIFDSRTGFTNTGIWAIHPDPDGSIWIGTGNDGLFHYKSGRFHQFTMRKGLYSDSIFSITEDDRGNFWMNCNRGIFTVSKNLLKEMEQNMRDSITCRSFGKAEGFKATESNGPAQFAACRTADGALWFSSIKGAIVIHPDKMPVNLTPPPVTIESIRVNGENYSPYESICALPGRGEIEIQYAGLSFLLPDKVAFKYRLEGFDSDWIDAGHRKAAYYTNLPPGQYTFHVIAANNDGIWNKTGRTLSITLQPRFTQTGWFKSIVVVLIIFFLLVLYLLRVKQIRHRERTLQAEVQERTYQLNQLNQKLADLARTDGLTGIANHRYLMHQLQRDWKTAFRDSAPISLIFIDIDRFKQYNDTFGHQAGDACLKTIAETLQKELKRPRDFLARYGGEEFVAILPNTGKDGALNMAETLRVAVEHSCSNYKKKVQVTISLGVSTAMPLKHNDFEKLISAADTALYMAKHNGRNRVEFSEIAHR